MGLYILVTTITGYAEILESILGVIVVAGANTCCRADAPILEAIRWIHVGIACYSWETTKEADKISLVAITETKTRKYLSHWELFKKKVQELTSPSSTVNLYHHE